MLIIDVKEFENEIERIYENHYKYSPNQAIQDIFNAIRKRINRYQKLISFEIESVVFRRATLSSTWIAYIYVLILGRQYEIILRIPREVNNPKYDGLCKVEVKR